MRRNWEHYHSEIKRTVGSIGWTFGDVHTILGEGLLDAEEEGVGREKAYRRIWREINEGVGVESGNRLVRRLKYYVGMMKELVWVVREG